MAKGRGKREQPIQLSTEPSPAWKGLKRGDLWAYVVFRLMDALNVSVWFVGVSFVVYWGVAYPIAVSAGKQTGVNIIYKAIVSAKIEWLM